MCFCHLRDIVIIRSVRENFVYIKLIEAYLDDRIGLFALCCSRASALFVFQCFYNFLVVFSREFLLFGDIFHFLRSSYKKCHSLSIR